MDDLYWDEVLYLFFGGIVLLSWIYWAVSEAIYRLTEGRNG